MRNETKFCKYCQTEIPKKAKVCPNCKKNQGGVANWIAAIIIIIGIMSILNGRGDKENSPRKVGEIDASNNTQEENKETTFKKGEIAELNGIQVALTDYKESSGSEWNRPSSEKTFLLAEFEISNKTDKEIVVSSIMSFNAYADDYALGYSFSAIAEEEIEQLDGTIASGKKLKGWIGWEVPKDYNVVEIHFTDGTWNNNKFVFVIEKN